MSYSKTLAADRRLVILKLLEKSAGYKSNPYLLQTALDDFGHMVSIDSVLSDMAWLEEQGLISIEKPGGVCIGTLTQRGMDVAAGRTTVPGVKRPGPDD